MSRALRMELLKLATVRTALWVALALLAICAVATISVVASTSGAVGSADERATIQIAATALVFSVLLGVLLTASEATHGTITQTFLVVPARLRVLAAKALVAAAAGVALALLAEAVVVAIGAAGLDLRPGDHAGLLLAIVAGAALAGALGAGLGAIFGGHGAAVAVTLVWLLVGENLAALLQEAQKYTPGRSFAALVSSDAQGSDVLLGTGGGVVASVLWTALFLLLGALLFVRRDV